MTCHPIAVRAQNVFECRSASVEIARRLIIDQISFDVRRREFFTIVGGSGTGKTTLLRVLGGLIRPSCGVVTFDTKSIAGPPENVVLVFQDYANALLQWRTVGRNVALGLEATLRRSDLQQRVMEALQLVGLERHANDYPWQLSGGMQQRVQIARALALRPEVMLMDEPFGALDAMTKASLQDELLKVHERIGTSFIFITHDIEEAVYLGSRVAVLGGPPGRIYKTVDIDLPRPRHQIVTRQMPAFLRYRQDLHEAIVKAKRA